MSPSTVHPSSVDKKKAFAMLKSFGAGAMVRKLSMNSIQYCRGSTMCVKVPVRRFREEGEAMPIDCSEFIGAFGIIVARSALELSQGPASGRVQIADRHHFPITTPGPDDMLRIRGEAKITTGGVPRLHFVATFKKSGKVETAYFGSAAVSYLPANTAPSSLPPAPPSQQPSTSALQSTQHLAPASHNAPKVVKSLLPPSLLATASATAPRLPIPPPSSSSLPRAPVHRHFSQKFMLCNIQVKYVHDFAALKKKLADIGVQGKNMEFAPLFISNNPNFVYYFDGKTPADVTQLEKMVIKDSAWKEKFNDKNMSKNRGFLSTSLQMSDILRHVIMATWLLKKKRELAAHDPPRRLPMTTRFQATTNDDDLKKAIKDKEVMLFAKELNERGRRMLENLRKELKI